MRYCPVPSVTAVRAFSMRAALAASTVTPGRTALDGSRTTPEMVAWANTTLGRSRRPTSAAETFPTRSMVNPPYGPWALTPFGLFRSTQLLDGREAITDHAAVWLWLRTFRSARAWDDGDQGVPAVSVERFEVECADRLHAFAGTALAGQDEPVAA